MSERCRTCGKIIFCLNLNNLFRQTESIMLHQIEALTGIFLLEQMEFPVHICAPCEVALRNAIVFRERVIRTQKLLLNSQSVEDALQKIDLDELENLNLNVCDEDDDADPSNRYEESPDYDYGADENETDTLEQQQQEANDELSLNEGQSDSESVPHIETDEPIAESAATAAASAPVQSVERKRKLYAALNFAIDTRNTPRINWSKLTEDEIVTLKRERRRRDCICELCGRHFTCPSNFKVHLLRHSGVKSFSCKQCPLKFYTPHLLRRHELAHLCEKPYPCHYCEQTFADHSGRIQHERNRHTNYRPYKCSKCDKSFAVSNKLKRHMFSHSGVRSFHCEICKVSFMRRPHLAAHIRSKGHEQNAQNYADMSNNVEIDIEKVLS
ncbi:transcription factor Ouib [Drosophila grimshawi]|uniref:GH18643 n=1 Tax=Drosophila grimshawi TaxID=7222 RepID=B4JH79_DROGR|nr:transcription factor Ouib [Drosophila grimshawi]EDV92770.1 GH18643 [Drosophila grimshawi]